MSNSLIRNRGRSRDLGKKCTNSKELGQFGTFGNIIFGNRIIFFRKSLIVGVLININGNPWRKILNPLLQLEMERRSSKFAAKSNFVILIISVRRLQINYIYASAFSVNSLYT